MRPPDGPQTTLTWCHGPNSSVVVLGVLTCISVPVPHSESGQNPTSDHFVHVDPFDARVA